MILVLIGSFFKIMIECLFIIYLTNVFLLYTICLLYLYVVIYLDNIIEKKNLNS